LKAAQNKESNDLDSLAEFIEAHVQDPQKGLKVLSVLQRVTGQRPEFMHALLQGHRSLGKALLKVQLELRMMQDSEETSERCVTLGREIANVLMTMKDSTLDGDTTIHQC